MIVIKRKDILEKLRESDCINLLKEESETLSILSDQYFWDGGFDITASLLEKAKFYTGCCHFKSLLSKILAELGEEVIYIGSFYPETSFYQKWKDLKSYEAFRNFKSQFKKNKIYQIETSKTEDNILIDYLIETGFRYFSDIDIFLPNSKVIINLDCHCQILFFVKNLKPYEEIFTQVIAKYNNVEKTDFKITAI